MDNGRYAKLEAILSETEAVLPQEQQDYLSASIAQLREENAQLSTRNEQLQEQSERDERTGIYNYVKFERDLRAAIKRIERKMKDGSFVPTKHDVSLLMIDLDGFKEYNATHLHEEGNVMLRQVAQTLSGGLREEERHHIYRYGGDEFAVLLPDTDPETGITVAQRLRRRVERYCNPITVSIGVSNYRLLCEQATQLVKSADKAMYRAKQTGKNRIGQYRRRLEGIDSSVELVPVKN